MQWVRVHLTLASLEYGPKLRLECAPDGGGVRLWEEAANDNSGGLFYSVRPSGCIHIAKCSFAGVRDIEF